jgi:hypothetical protein
MATNLSYRGRMKRGGRLRVMKFLAHLLLMSLLRIKR